MLGRLPELAQVDVRQPDADFLAQHLRDYDAYLASLHVRLDRPTILSAQRLKVVATPTTGLDHLDLNTLAERKIHLISLKHEIEFLDRVTATAELAWGLLLAAVRKIPAASRAAEQGQWARDRFRGRQLSGKTLGILGLGRLGKMVAAYGQAFRLNVLGCDLKPMNLPGVRQVALDTLLRESDIISIHIHLTPENRSLLGPAQFASMKQGVVLVNTSRGAILDESALLQALVSGKVAAAGLDVIDGEWRTDLAEHSLIRYARTHENLVITPHLGGVTVESQIMTSQFIADKAADYLRGQV